MNKPDQQQNPVNRRELLLGMGMAAMAFSPLVNASMKGHKHDHSRHKPQNEDVLEAVNECIDKGQRCIAHCLVLFQEGDTSVAECAQKVHEMKAVCTAFSYLLTANSTHNPQMASLCDKLCRECEEECRKHDEHHECRECAEACEDVVKVIKKQFA